ncbi:MAG TPA: alpha/beta hydrolase-fold protein [Chloroflexota bacterium]
MRNEIDSLLERARDHGTPLVDDRSAIFVWEGDEAPELIGDFNQWGWQSPPTPLEQVASGLWAHTMPLPSDAYLEYSYRVGDGRVNDPFNPNLGPNGVGGFHNWFAMPDFAETPLTEERSGPARGTVTPHEVECHGFAVGDRRRVHLYRPATDYPCPLLLVFDGDQYLEHGRLVQIVDNLIAQERIRPINMALVDAGDRARFVEYCCSDATLRFLERFILPLAHEHLNVIEDATVHGVLGASMGGLMALYAALRAPARFGLVLSQSGAFGFGPDAHFESVIYDVVRHASARPAIWMDAGRYEGFVEMNCRMRDLLTERGYGVTYREYNGGHNYICWRNDVWRGIEALYGRRQHNAS